MHEHGHDQAGLEQHEDQDQGPAQQALQVVVVHGVRHHAQHEEQGPDLQVQADRVLLLPGEGVAARVHGVHHR
ncbi:hypothetical protein FQZ97_1231090 [compost metagenome]